MRWLSRARLFSLGARPFTWSFASRLGRRRCPPTRDARSHLKSLGGVPIVSAADSALTRRHLLRRALGFGIGLPIVGSLLAACAQQPAAAPTAAPAKPTTAPAAAPTTAPTTAPVPPTAAPAANPTPAAAP